MSEGKKPGTFTKGDKRINRKGRPKSFDALRALAQEIAHEELQQKDGSTLTVTQAILKKWAGSNDARLQMAFIEYAYGKPPQQTENKTQLTGAGGGPIQTAGTIEVKSIDYRADIVSSEIET